MIISLHLKLSVTEKSSLLWIYLMYMMHFFAERTIAERMSSKLLFLMIINYRYSLTYDLVTKWLLRSRTVSFKLDSSTAVNLKSLDRLAITGNLGNWSSGSLEIA